MEGWFKLEARSNRSSVQGRIRLKLWLSTREDRGTSEEDNTLEVKKFERLQTIFMMHEVHAHEPTWKWNGELAGPSLTILHQIAVQSDLSDLQISMAKYDFTKGAATSVKFLNLLNLQQTSGHHPD